MIENPAALAARHPHGTRVRYVAGRCRCQPCRTANTAYAKSREAAKRRGETNEIVDAAPVRAHLARLSAAGVGRRTVADISGVPPSTVGEIAQGRQKNLRARTAAAIMRVTAEAIVGGMLVPAAPAWARINELLSLGFTRGEIALAIGMRQRALQLNKHVITARNAHRVEQAYRRLMAMLVRRLEVRAEMEQLGHRGEEVAAVLELREARRREMVRERARRRKGWRKRP